MHEAREDIARIIDPIAFKSWEGLYQYCMNSGDTEEWARGAADGFHRKSMDEALAKADAILARLAPAPETVAREIPLWPTEMPEVMVSTAADYYCREFGWDHDQASAIFAGAYRSAALAQPEAASVVEGPLNTKPVVYNETASDVTQDAQPEAARVGGFDVYSDDGRLAGMDDGATFVLTSLAEILGVKEWEMKSGSEEWDGDVDATMYGILEQARVVDPWDNSIARHETLHEYRAALATQPAAGSEG